MCRNMWAHLRITTVLGCSRRDLFPPTFEEQTKKQKQKQQHQKQKWQKPNNYCSLRDLFPLTCESELGNQQQQHQQQDQRKYQQQFAISIWYAISTISISFRRHVKLSMEIKMNIQQYNKNIIIQYQNENTQQQQQQQPSTVEGGNNICSPQLWLANWKRCQSLQLRYSDNRPILFLFSQLFCSLFFYVCIVYVMFKLRFDWEKNWYWQKRTYSAIMQNMIFDSVFEVDSVLENKSDF